MYIYINRVVKQQGEREMSRFIKATVVEYAGSKVEHRINSDSIESFKDGKIRLKNSIVLEVVESLEQIEAQLLRDEFAMAAMSGFMSGDCSPYETANWIATYAYDQADAMLKERLK